MAQIATESTETVATPTHANPAPLGLSGFAVTTLLLSLANAGVLPATDITFLGLAFAFGGLAQLIAGILEFRGSNTLGATAFVSYGAFWISFAIGILTKSIGGTGAAYYLLAWGILTLIFLLSALRTNLALIAVFFFLTLTFLALAIGDFGAGSTWAAIGGWLGIVTAIVAEYLAFADLLSASNSVFTLPTFPVL